MTIQQPTGQFCAVAIGGIIPHETIIERLHKAKPSAPVETAVKPAARNL
ncbi:hypothetical protein [Acidisphaera sp. S103]|nr:hypothetical protein [Acidisphaera sp. S103]